MTVQAQSYDMLKDELIKDGSAIITFETEDELPNNTSTMVEFLDLFDIPDEDIELFDGSYVELKVDNKSYRVDASGNGCFRTHKIEIQRL
jgi:hypothetical protein